MEEVQILGGKGILSISPNELSAPIEILMELTWKCNLKCMHCMMSADYSNNVGENELTTQEIKHVIDRACELGVSHIDFSGGEPLLRKDICEIIEYASSKKIAPCLLTNGTLIDNKMAENLKKAGTAKIELNLDGHTPEIYDRFRGVDGAFKRTVYAIKAIQNVNISLRVNSILCKALYPYFANIVDYAGKLGINELCFIPLRMAGNTLKRINELAFSPAEYAHNLPDMKKVKEDMQQKYNMLILYPGDEQMSAYVDPVGCFPKCGAGRLHCTIGADGSVRPCPAFPAEEEYIAGNIRQDDIGDIWNKAAIFKKLRKPEIKGCEDCENKNCMGGCRVQSLWKYGNIETGPEPYCEKIIKKEFRAFTA